MLVDVVGASMHKQLEVFVFNSQRENIRKVLNLNYVFLVVFRF